MKRFGVIYHPHNEGAVKQAEYVKEYLTKKGCSCFICQFIEIGSFGCLKFCQFSLGILELIYQQHGGINQ